MTLHELAEGLRATGQVSLRELGGGVIMVGYASHNWLFAVEVGQARKWHWWGNIVCVNSVEAALRTMGIRIEEAK